MPGAVARTSTFAFTNATLPFISNVATSGIYALRKNHHLLAGLNIHKGSVTCKAVSETLGCDYLAPEDAISD